MSKRPAIDLAALTSEAAAPMSEASQRIARPAIAAVPPPAPAVRSVEPATKTANLQALAFKGHRQLEQLGLAMMRVGGAGTRAITPPR